MPDQPDLPSATLGATRSESQDPDEQMPPGGPRTRLIALIVACALFMQNLDGTVIATALPTMGHDFGVDPVHMNVALTSYLLSLAVLIPASGWFADRFGARTIFRAAIAVFTLGSVLCGRADSLTFLVAARLLQGAGGAMMVPVGRLVLLRTAAKHELVGAMAWLSVPALIGPVVGPPLGGFLVTYASWRWIFDINVPIGLLGIALVTAFVPNAREPGGARLDVRGLVLSGVAMVSLMFGLEALGRHVVSDWVAVGAIGFGLAVGAVYVLHAQDHAAPLLDLGLFRISTFLVSVLGGSLFRIGVGATPFLLPLMLQLGFGFSPLQSGMITLASSAGAMVMKPTTMFALRRFGFRDTLLVNGALAAVTIIVCGAFRPAWPIWLIYAVLLIGGTWRSLQFTAYNTVAFADIPRARMSAATSLYSTLQQVSLTLGVTAGAAALQVSMAVYGHSMPSLGDFTLAFVVVGGASLVAAPTAWMMAPDAGEELSGHRSAARAASTAEGTAQGRAPGAAPGD
jgi:EmrB/QacA subfamily drug resistance transporter